MKIHLVCSKEIDRNANGDINIRIFTKIKRTEYVKSKLIKPKDINARRIPSKLKSERTFGKSDQNNVVIFSYISEKDNCKEKRTTPNSRRISVTKSKKSIIYSQIDEEKWISMAENKNLVKK